MDEPGWLATGELVASPQIRILAVENLVEVADAELAAMAGELSGGPSAV
jgi:hypothetical protein